jgi:linoleoyl-CoA desaturase
MHNVKPLTFATTARDFHSTLNQRVNHYFKVNQLTKNANGEMYFKTVFMFLLYWIPYTLLVTGQITGMISLLGFSVVMGFGIAGIGLSVMHDANHGSYSKRPWVNQLLAYSLNMIGAGSFNWRMQHNVLHHTFTNVHDHDEDINPRGVLRFSPSTPWKRFHRYQFIYAWFAYGLMTIVWIVVKDFERIQRYQETGLVRKQKANITQEWIILLVTKVVYVSYVFILPLVFTPFMWWQILCGWLVMHYVAGFLLAIIFQPAHVSAGTEYPLPDGDQNLENSWAVHQLITTANFGNKSRLLTWYCGGLNFQIEHHLFPRICHVHYSKIADVVRLTAHEFGLPYKSFPTFLDALKGHGKMLRELGVKPGL